MSVVYRIPNWSGFENNKSKGIEACRYVCLPNKQHGLGFRRVMRRPDGMAIFGAWTALVQKCSQQKTRDGWLTEDGTPTGTPWSADDLADLWGRPVEEIEEMLSFMCSDKMRWLEILQHKCPSAGTKVPAGGTQVPATGLQVPPKVQEGRKEGKEEGTPTADERQPDGEGDPPPPSSDIGDGKAGKAEREMRLRQMLVTHEMCGNGLALVEFETLIRKRAKCRTWPEADAFLRWVREVADRKGFEVKQARHAEALATNWNEYARDEQFTRKAAHEPVT